MCQRLPALIPGLIVLEVKPHEHAMREAHVCVAEHTNTDKLSSQTCPETKIQPHESPEQMNISVVPSVY